MQFGARGLVVLLLTGLTSFLLAAGRWPVEAAESPAPRSLPKPVASARAQAWAVEVKGGSATFRLPDGMPRGPALVVVSSLSQDRGPFGFSIEAFEDASAVHDSRCLSVAPLDWRVPEARSQERLQDCSGEGTRGPAAPAAARCFSLLMRPDRPALASSYLPVQARLRAYGRRTQVYVDRRDEQGVSDAWACRVRDLFEHEIEPEFAGRWGVARDVDGDGRFTIMVSSWLDRFGNGQSRLDGFVRSADFDDRFPAPLGNQCDMLYLKAGIDSVPHLRTVMAHEYAHAVGFCRKSLGRVQADGTCLEEEGWLDEAMAHAVEDELGDSRTNLDDRVAAFLAEPWRFHLVVPDYQAWDLFRSEGHRGSTYLFLKWCLNQQGPTLLNSLWGTDRTGTDNLEAATHLPFAELFRAWTLDLFREHGPAESRPAGKLGFERLRPGEGLFHWSAAGTSARFFVVEPGKVDRLTIAVQGSSEARMQITLMPLGEGDPPQPLAMKGAGLKSTSLSR